MAVDNDKPKQNTESEPAPDLESQFTCRETNTGAYLFDTRESPFSKLTGKTITTAVVCLLVLLLIVYCVHCGIDRQEKTDTLIRSAAEVGLADAEAEITSVYTSHFKHYYTVELRTASFDSKTDDEKIAICAKLSNVPSVAVSRIYSQGKTYDFSEDKGTISVKNKTTGKEISGYTEWKAQRMAEAQKKYKDVYPAVGMSEEFIELTGLGKPAKAEAVRNPTRYDPYYHYEYTWRWDTGEKRCVATVQKKYISEWGTVTNVKLFDKPNYPAPGSSTKKKDSDPYYASDFSHAEDFYDWYPDDFLDYEDAEEYWEKHQK